MPKSKNSRQITIFEHQKIKLNQQFGEEIFDAQKLKAFQQYYGDKGVPYYSLIHNGIQFCEYVGVIQVGNMTIEVLPKADKNENESQWRDMLIGMLRSIGVFSIHAPTSSSLSIKPNSILDLYFELFIIEIEYILHLGLIKKYRKAENNLTSLKGSIQFPKHIQKNLVHQELFFVKHTTYDGQHQLHQILYKTLILINNINTNIRLQSRIGQLLLNFPEQVDIQVHEGLFEKLNFDRKSENYRKAIEIARLLLLNYHPNLSQGQNHVLALMFDMNLLWEQFVYISLRKYKAPGISISPQASKSFWKPKTGRTTSIRPDIVIKRDNTNIAVLDTKWKNLNGYNPSPDDLRQMYVYQKYFASGKVMLVYPGDFESREGIYFRTSGEVGEASCTVMGIAVNNKLIDWQKEISKKINDWIEIEARIS